MRRIFGTLRNHWKKSLFFAGAGAYGTNVGIRKWMEWDLMKGRCMEAVLMGEETSLPTRITVILNPAADSGKARKKYEDYCAPLLHLAGLKVSVIRTEGVGQAKEIMSLIKDSDAVLIAGGDGTLMEVVTGLLRRPDADQFSKTIPLGILPVGAGNRMAKTLFYDHAKNDVDLMSAATMSVLKKLFRPMDVMEVANVEEEEAKKLYGLRGIEIGAFRDAAKRKDKFWLFGGLKKVLTYAFAYTTSHKEINWDLNGKILYSETEEIEKIYNEKNASPTETKTDRGWPWSWVFKNSSSVLPPPQPIIRKIRQWISLPLYEGLEISISTENNSSRLEKKETNHLLELRLGPRSMNFLDFASEGWNRESGVGLREELYSRSIAKAIRFSPGKMIRTDDVHFSLDDENVDLKGAMEISLIPNKVLMFCAPDNHFEFSTNEEKSQKIPKKLWRNDFGGSNITRASKFL